MCVETDRADGRSWVGVGASEGVEQPTWKVGKCDVAPPPREWHRAAVLDGAMFVFGGHTADGNENALFRLARKPELGADV